MRDLRAALAQHFLLKDLSPEDLDRVGELATTRWYQAGQPVFMKGDPGTAMMAVLSGRIRICAYSADGREVVLNVINPGEVFGEIALIDGGERTADAFAMEATELLCLSRRDFLPYLERNPEVCIKLLTIICQRLRSTSEQLEDLNFLDLRCRLAKRLLYLAAVHGEPTAKGIHIGVRLPQHLLASMIGTSREAVNKQLRDWEAKGFIDVRRGSVTILDRNSLEAVVTDTSCAPDAVAAAREV
ncbi:MAG TPA: Crp/Fnr family transcriptional regulator [Rhodospirillales bacterium]|nr:Crp/Fnr family transcriptional regulator [Rhodospirillales bacterium]